MAVGKYIGDVAQRRLEQIEQMAGRPEMITGVPTGFTDFDQMTSGLQRQDLIVIAGDRAVRDSGELDPDFNGPLGLSPMPILPPGGRGYA